MLDGKLVIHAIADIHFGSSYNSEKLYDELHSEFIDKINFEVTDLIVFSGDYFQKVLSLNKKDGHFAMRFFYEIYQLTQEHDIYLRIIQGTEGHDLEQLNNFSVYEYKSKELSFAKGDELSIEKRLFRIIRTVEEEELYFEDVDEPLYILYLPEEYPEDQYSYYKKFYNNEYFYDIIFGHGTFKFTAFLNQKLESEKDVHSSVVFDEEFLSKIVEGPIIFGHIHSPQQWKNKIFYTSSFSRWAFGEEKDKGSLKIKIPIEDRGNYEVERIKNERTLSYSTVDVKVFEEMTHSEVIPYIDALKEKFDKVRFMGKFDDPVIGRIIHGTYSNESNVKMASQVITKEKIKDKVETKYSFLTNHSLSIPQIIQKFIKLEYNKEIGKERIAEIIKDED